MSKLEATGRMSSWATELGGCAISFEPRKAIKGQALDDFLVETIRVVEPEAAEQVWKVYVNGSSTMNGCGDGIIYESPEGDKFEYALRFKFQASNNESKHEALLAGLRMCKAAVAKKINACSDSQLILS